MKFGLNITKDLTNKLYSTLSAMTGKHIRLGFDDPEVARIALINEVGSPMHNLPARPILVPGVEAAKPEIIKAIAAGAAKSIATFSATPMTSAWEKAGQAAVDGARAIIDDHDTLAPLAESTLRARRARGNSDDTPRYDTGHTYADLKYYVESK
jgi:hypothetical protein